ncbi:hypothetical protein CBL_10475 [Carabus blaptoides fortunei]
MLTMRSFNQTSKVTPPPPVPPRPSKTVVAEALAKSRKLSPVRALYATQPLSAVCIAKDDHANGKPVVPVRSAPPPPLPKPHQQIAQAQVVKSYSSAMVFKPQVKPMEDNRISRSISDDGAAVISKPRNVVFQSANVKTSKIEVNLLRKPSVNRNNELKRVESTKNERNKVVKPIVTDRRNIQVSSTVSEIPPKSKDTSANVETARHCVTITAANATETVNSKPVDTVAFNNDKLENATAVKRNSYVMTSSITSNEHNETPNQLELDKPGELKCSNAETSDKIVQSIDKTMIIVNSAGDDANNNIFQQSQVPESVDRTKMDDCALSVTNLDDHTSDSSVEKDSKESTSERKLKKVQFDDNINHEFLIAELQSMREEQERLLKRQRKAPVDIYDCDTDSVYSDRSTQSRIQHSDWVEVANNGEEVRLSSCQIYIDNASEESKSSSLSSRKSTSRVPSMSSLHGLPPLPKSLSGFNLLENSHRIETPRGSYRIPASPGPQTPSRAGSSRGPTPPTPGSGSGHVVYPPHPRVNGTTEIPRGRKITTLDTQLAILRREMYGLRQLDLSLLSQLYSLNEAIQDFRQILQEQEDNALSPHSPSPSPSSGDEGDEFYSPTPMRFKPAPPAPPLRRTSNSSSANSSEYGTGVVESSTAVSLEMCDICVRIYRSTFNNYKAC